MSVAAGIRAGVARRSLQLPEGTWLAGYPNPFRQHRSVRDPLSLTALAVEGEDAGQRALIVSMDLLAIHDELASALRARLAEHSGVPAHAILLSCIHSHSSPLGSALPSSPPAQHAFLAHLEEQLLAAAREAVHALVPVTLGRATGSVVIGHNRRELTRDGRVVIGTNPDREVDADLDVVALRTSDGRALATLVNHACHPTILSPLNRRASAEWPGAMRALMEAEGAGTVLCLQGATGDVDPNHRWLRGGDAAVTRLGQTVGEAALALLRGPLEPVLGASVQARATVLPLALSVPDESAEGTSSQPTLPRHARELSRQTHVPARWADPLLDRMYPWACTARRDAQQGWVAPVALHSLRIGDLGIASCGAELFQESGRRIKADSPAARTLVAGYTNGMLGYVAPEADHALGGYEVEQSPFLYRLPGVFAPTSEGAVRAALQQQLTQLFAPPH